MDIADSLTYHITKTGNILRQVTAKRIKSAGINLTPEESVLMNQLWDRDNQTLGELGQWSVKDSSTLTLSYKSPSMIAISSLLIFTNRRLDLITISTYFAVVPSGIGI